MRSAIERLIWYALPAIFIATIVAMYFRGREYERSQHTCAPCALEHAPPARPRAQQNAPSRQLGVVR